MMCCNVFTCANSKTNKILALDFGDKTIGVAVNKLDSVATGVTTLRRTAPEALRANLKQLKEIIREYGVTHILLGYPKHLHGEDSLRCEKTLEFKAKLERYFKLPVKLWDERLSTQAVSRVFNGKRSNYKKHVDEMAAVYILQGFLDFITNRRNNMEPTDWDNMDDEGIVLFDEDDNEMPLQVLASKEDEGILYVLAVDDEESEVAHFKCTPTSEDEVLFELIDEDHKDFKRVFNLFKDDYEELGIDIEGIDI